jgi:GNAT superfamily N-acetyltransferase
MLVVGGGSVAVTLVGRSSISLCSGMKFTIQQAAPSDVPALLKLIRELARFERLEHEVQTTADSIQTALFGPRPAAGALIARRSRGLAGYAIYFFTFSSFVGRPGLWLDDVYVRPSCRNQGLGRALIEAVARIGVERNCGRFEWSALNWNQNALEFYRNLGAQVMDQWVMLRLDSEGLRHLAAPAAAAGNREPSNILTSRR